jgi:hypothetical protein
MTDPSTDDGFPELEELRAGLAARHRRLLQIMVTSSIILIVVGTIFVVISQNPEKLGYALPGLFLVVLGIFGLGRAAYSHFTDFDTRDRHEFVGVADDVDEIDSNGDDARRSAESDHE